MILNQYFLIVPLLLIPTVIQQRKGQSSNHIIMIAHCSPRSIALSEPYTIILYHFIIHLHKVNSLRSTIILLRLISYDNIFIKSSLLKNQSKESIIELIHSTTQPIIVELNQSILTAIERR